MPRLLRFFLFFMILGIAVTGCSAAETPSGIGGAKARALVARGALLIDVRSSIEFWWSHIDGAVNISSSSLPDAMQKFDRTRPIVVYSRSGARSAKAKDLLVSAGFEAYDLGAKSSW